MVIASTLALAVLSGLAGAWLRGRHQHAALEAERRERLRQALAEYGAALDALITEIEGMPPVGAGSRAVTAWLERRAPMLDYFFGRLATATLGRSASAAVQRYGLATNLVMLAAPREVLALVERISAHLGRFEPGNPVWLEELRTMRAALAGVSREATAARPRALLHLPFRRPAVAHGA
jgi:hypothetical protein